MMAPKKRVASYGSYLDGMGGSSEVLSLEPLGKWVRFVELKTKFSRGCDLLMCLRKECLREVCRVAI